MSNPGLNISLIFIAVAAIFLVVSIKDYLRTNGKTTAARQTWLRVSFIFAAVGTILAFMHS
jgi:hypothetical protein